MPVGTVRTDRRSLPESHRVADTARKVVGVGRAGTRCWITLLLGEDDEAPPFLRAEEAEEAHGSVPAPCAGGGTLRTQGERVAAGQRLVRAAGDVFPGRERVQGVDGRRRDFCVRRLRG